jgi:uncharacterized membrane protein YphA (DoxX/SURF4 family)
LLWTESSAALRFVDEGIAMARRLAQFWYWAGLLARLLVGGVWIAAGVLKLPDPAESVRAVRAYQLLPEAIVPTVGHGLPALEIVIGALMILGLGLRISAAVSALLQVAFIIGIASAWARGLEIECGCFGGGGTAADASSKYPWEIARDVGLFALSALLVFFPRTALRLDSLFALDKEFDE